jgi:hypothetical protein
VVDRVISWAVHIGVIDMKFPAILTALVSLQFAAVAAADVPVTFQPGTPARAADVNQNFNDLDTRLNASLGGIVLTQFTNSAPGVTSASCPANSLVVSANCDCDGDGTTRNFGILFGCQVAGNGGVAGCFPEGITFDPFIGDPTVTINIVCAGALRNDGTVITPVLFSETASLSSSQKSAPISENSKTASDELESEAKKLNDQLLDIKTKMRSTTN